MQTENEGWSWTFKQICKNYWRKHGRYNKKKKVVYACPSENDFFIMVENRKCLLYGNLKQAIGYQTTQGQLVYYDAKEDKFILNISGTIIKYHFNTLKSLVHRNGNWHEGKTDSKQKLNNAISEMPLQININP